jgi:hypothetical protein
MFPVMNALPLETMPAQAPGDLEAAVSLMPPAPVPGTLPDDWAVVTDPLVAGRVVARVVVGPNGVFAVTLDPDRRPAELTDDGLWRDGVRVTTPVKDALFAAYELRQALARGGLDVFPYPLLLAAGARGRLDRLLIAPPGQLAEAIWSHPGRPLRRSERARALGIVQHPLSS